MVSRNRSWAKCAPASSSTTTLACTASSSKSVAVSGVRSRALDNTSNWRWSPSTAATASISAHAGETRASRSVNVWRTLSGKGPAESPRASTSRVSSRTNNGLPPLRRHTALACSSDGCEPAMTAISVPTSAGLSPVQRQHLTAKAEQRTRGFLVAVRTQQQHPFRGTLPCNEVQ